MKWYMKLAPDTLITYVLLIQPGQDKCMNGMWSFVTACPYNLCCESVSRKCKKASKTFINLCTPCLCKHNSKTNKKRLPMFKSRVVISKTQQLLHCSFPRKHPTNPSVAKSSHLCYTFKGRLKSGTFSHFDGMLFNHQGCTWQRKFRVFQIIHHLLRRSPQPQTCRCYFRFVVVPGKGTAQFLPPHTLHL